MISLRPTTHRAITFSHNLLRPFATPMGSMTAPSSARTRGFIAAFLSFPVPISSRTLVLGFPSTFTSRCPTHVRTLAVVPTIHRSRAFSTTRMTAVATESNTGTGAGAGLVGPPQAPSALGHLMKYEEVGGLRRLARGWRLLRQVRGRLARGTILTIRLGGNVPDSDPSLSLIEMVQGGARETSLDAFTSGIRLGAHDPRISSVLIVVDTLTCGWARVLEMRRHLQYFADADKDVIVFMESGGAKEFFLGMGFQLYVPPLGGLSLNGFQVSATFVRGVLDKVGVAPQVERIGDYKSAGDQLARTEMSDAQRESLTSLLGAIDTTWCTSVAEACGVTEDVLRDIVDRCPKEMEEYVKAGLVTDLKYLSEVRDMLIMKQKRRSESEKESEILKKGLASVSLKQYRRRTREKMLGLGGGGGKKVAIIRANGAITSGKSGRSPTMGSTLGSDTLVTLLRKAREDKRVAAVVIRCDSPGGSALASDIVYREVQRLRETKPVVASMGDVAASGGYYISMGASDVVAESLTLTGSVGVVTAKLSLGELYDKIGYTKETISIGRYAEILADERKFTDDEAKYFREFAEFAYKCFVSKAADARGKSYEQMHEVAQGRVWTGQQALERGMVDHIGGLRKAVEVAAEKAGLDTRFINVQNITEPTGIAKLLGMDSDGIVTPKQFGTNAPMAIAEVGPLLSGPSPLMRFLTAAAAAAPEFAQFNNAGNSVLFRSFESLFRSVLGTFERR